ncbi:hypothetical protein CK623_10315 [Vandammella animalimorsus]|uniref:EamA domain-containing protein n=1 Tax=Vandammella animalimorsus TaxID=2029117 RepID=A0A2A2ANM7_9BURK|nr:hypothetical protein CK623_10315 [Vandammella animalimorsus]
MSLFFSGEYVQRLGALRLVGLATSFACLCCIAQFLLTRPLSTIALGVWLLGEPFIPWLAAGTALVVAGIWLFSRAGRR